MFCLPGRRDRVRRSLRASMYEGSWFNVMLGVTESYLTPFAVFLHASPQAIGSLYALKSLAGSLPQLWSARIVEGFGSRKRCMQWLTFWHAALWLPTIVVPLMVPAPWRVPAFVGLIALSAVVGSLTVPPYGSVLAEYVPGRMRGQYFGWRNRVHGIVNLTTIFAAGLFLHLARQRVYLAFCLLFFLAAVTRWMSWWCLGRMHEPSLPSPPTTSPERLHPFAFFRTRFGRAFAPFALFVFLFLFATHLAAPFMAVYLLEELRYSYLAFTVLMVAASFAYLAAMTWWGRQADRFGNMAVLKAGAVGTVVIPFLWLASPNPYYLVGVQMLSGALGAGFNLAMSNFAFEAASARHRTQSIAMLNVLSGLAIFAGALSGGWLVTRLDPLWHSPILTLILISGLVRASIVAGWVTRLEEVRRVTAIPVAELIANAGRSLIVHSRRWLWPQPQEAMPRVWAWRTMRVGVAGALALAVAVLLAPPFRFAPNTARMSLWDELDPLVNRLSKDPKAALRGTRSVEQEGLTTSQPAGELTEEQRVTADQSSPPR